MGVKFADKVLVVLTTSPAGLGHIRVMSALQSGLSDKTRVAVLGLSDPAIQWMHRLTSRNRHLCRLMEFTQENGLAERWFSGSYRDFLRTHTQKTVRELTEIVSQQKDKPETVVVMATHFGLGHQLAAVKAELAEKMGVSLFLAVVVTDDSPQEMWAVTGADVIFVPTNTTRETLLNHLQRVGGRIPEVVTVPYPVSLSLGEQLSEEEFAKRQKQARGQGLEVAIPVSGAAVQLDYFQDLIRVILAEKYRIRVISRESVPTKSFLEWCRNRSGVQVVSKVGDDEVVAAYEEVYWERVITAEVTKPSEQAFKALYTPKQRGGASLLFSPPVGRQEKDNLAFLRRHRLIPSADDQARLTGWGVFGNRLLLNPPLLERARHWRGVMLPADGTEAGRMIVRLAEGGVLAAMTDWGGYIEGHQEISCEGVKRVWEWLKSGPV
jgi:hypothetical protein